MNLPELQTELLRPAQVEAVNGVEHSLAAQQFDRSLVQVATGAGKTYTAVTESYRLLKHGGFNKILFLVDRNNLADQTLAEFQNFRTPDDGRRFTELYNVAKLSSVGLLGSTAVSVSTIQRVFRFIKTGEVSGDDDPNVDDYVPDVPVTVSYSAALPPETFDLVIVDEAHRSIYGVWRGVLEYFDADVVGLTATSGKQTFAFFRQNLVSDYTYPESVPTVSTSTSMYTASAPRSASRVRTSRLGRSCRRLIGAPASSDSKRSTKIWNTARVNWIGRSRPPTRSAPC